MQKILKFLPIVGWAVAAVIVLPLFVPSGFTLLLITCFVPRAVVIS